MKKTLFILSLVTFFLIFSGISYAQMMNYQNDNSSNEVSVENHETLDEVLPKILQKYNVSKIQDLDCSEITDEDFEIMGEAVMETAHPGAAHEAMDEMMGGEGSESLDQAHINMGKNYLGCQTESVRGFGMMGRNFNMPMTRAYTLDNNLNYGFTWVIWIVNSLLITVLLILLNIFVWKKAKK